MNKVKNMCITGIFTAVIFIFTAYLHIPSHTGYTHVGDAFIYLAACLLPLPYAIFAGAFGALLADCLTGFALWAPASIIIKSITTVFFTRKKKRLLCARNVIALFPAALLCCFGYYLYEALLTNNYLSPLAGIPGYATQSVLSGVVFLVSATVLDKFDVKDRLFHKGV